ncbi:putative ABC transport system ATP-binding protein [Hungatella effluvii]|uniref:Putative ABC transport system ATP-binding protein n=1 Tax=Hungatella effluvii TaxID=1096246 RepID=A0A2V3YC76_9FIRM|nr:ABC transporter ATP-binding protein [Hungatella effluvii]PXX56746.1 putative ABC transport system ATP-binding protein [Hungatella effluvii]
MAAGKPVIRADHLSVRYEGEGVAVDALKDVTFEVEQGEFIVVLGPSGSGKSTLLNIVGGMDKPTGGEIWYKDRELTGYTADQLSDYRKDVVGFVFQFFNLIPSLNAVENVELAASIVKEHMDPKEVLAMVGLGGRERHFPAQLSGGEQQRVSIARAIVKKPDLLLCDEPTGALDSKNSVAIVKLLLEVGRSLNCPVMTITHNAEMVRVADRVFHMKDGRLQRITVNEHPCQAEELDW